MPLGMCAGQACIAPTDAPRPSEGLVQAHASPHGHQPGHHRLGVNDEPQRSTASTHTISPAVWPTAAVLAEADAGGSSESWAHSRHTHSRHTRGSAPSTGSPLATRLGSGWIDRPPSATRPQPPRSPARPARGSARRCPRTRAARPGAPASTRPAPPPRAAGSPPPPSPAQRRPPAPPAAARPPTDSVSALPRCRYGARPASGIRGLGTPKDRPQMGRLKPAHPWAAGIPADSARVGPTPCEAVLRPAQSARRRDASGVSASRARSCQRSGESRPRRRPAAATAPAAASAHGH